MSSSNLLEQLRGGLIVSCQASPGDPTYGSEYMVAFAKAAQRGGAVGLRVNGPQDVRAVKEATRLPVIGIWKRTGMDGAGHIITPSLDDALALKAAGADVIAADVGDRPRPGGIDAGALIRQIRAESGLLLMADCATVREAVRAEAAGADLVGSTRFPPFPQDPYRPHLEMIADLLAAVQAPVIAEGNFWDPGDLKRAFEIGVHSIVIGSAITRPWLITARYSVQTPSGGLSDIVSG